MVEGDLKLGVDIAKIQGAGKALGGNYFINSGGLLREPFFRGGGECGGGGLN